MAYFPPLPTKQQLLDWLADNPHARSKRDIARAFGLKGAQRVDLKHLLKELEAEGHLEKRRNTYREAGTLPPVAVLKLMPPDAMGDVFATVLDGHGQGPEPRILFSPRAADPALGGGDRVLARLHPVQGQDYHYTARLIRKISASPRKILGIFRQSAEGGRIVPIAKSHNKDWMNCRTNCSLNLAVEFCCCWASSIIAKVHCSFSKPSTDSTRRPSENSVCSLSEKSILVSNRKYFKMHGCFGNRISLKW